MSMFFYQKLARTNIKNNSKTYVPYIITCIGTVLLFFNMASLTFHNSTGEGSLAAMMMVGTVVTGLFSVIFLFYTNSFLVKRRKKEFGLFNILGMDKKHIGKVMCWETVLVAGISLVVGLLLGILFNRLITMLLYKMLHFDPRYQFEISGVALLLTLALFAGIFLVTLLSSLWQVYRAKPIELLRGGEVGEREPKSNWLLTILGALALGAGYYLALSIQNPLNAILNFFIAVFCVIIGTYCLFTAGSVVFLKMLKKNKAYFYKTKHFVSVSSMIYRMKKHAVGLANICIMSTAVLVMVSTTISMYVGMDDLMTYRYPQDAIITVRYTSDTRPDGAALQTEVEGLLTRDQMAYQNFSSLEFLDITVEREGNRYQAGEEYKDILWDKMSTLVILSEDDYTRASGQSLSLMPDEVVIYSERKMDQIEILGQSFSVKESREGDLPIAGYRAWLNDTVYVVVQSPDVLDTLYQQQLADYGERASQINYQMSFDFEGTDDDVATYCRDVFWDALRAGEVGQHIMSSDFKQMNIQEFYLLYGGLFFLGLFLGTLFLLATVLIIYYKQVIEGFEDKERFAIMQKVGMSQHEVKKSIGSQILTVFALPILAAIVHIIVAFPILKTLLGLLNLTNVSLFITCTIFTVLAFILIYVVVYLLTSRVYYKIVNTPSTAQK